MITTAGNQGEDDSGNFLYYDHENQVTFSFNPFSQAATITNEGANDVATSPFRDQLCSELNAICKNPCFYTTGKWRFNVYQQGDPSHMIIEISVLNVSLSNFWSGEWQS